MIKIVLTIAAFILLALTTAFSQNDSTRYINGLPVSEDDTVGQFPQQDLGAKNKLIAVEVNDLPPKLLDVLKKEEQYHGWQDSTIYFEKNTGIYHVPVKYEEGVKIFGLNENGDPVSFREVTPRPD
ncbi:MAG: hypothetical protein WD824_13900 [Cyclobacteriaceae bacterium]